MNVDDVGRAMAGRAAWLCHIRQALDAADSVARQLATCAEVGPDAAALLLRLQMIRNELDSLQGLAPQPWPGIAPLRTDSLGPFCS